MKQNKRIEYLDYAKAIAIVLVMLDHRDTDLGVFVCCALPLFFMSSGVTTNVNKYSIKEYLMHITKRLLPPFWIAMLVYIGLELFRGPMVGYGDTSLVIPGLANTIYGSSKFPVIGPFTERLVEIMSFKQQFDPKTVEAILPLTCHLWYLTAFYSGCAVFFCCKKFNKKNSLVMDGLMIVVLLLLTSIEVLPHMFQLPYGLGRGFLCAAYMIVGSRIKSVLEEESITKIALSVIVSAIAVAICFNLGSNCGAMVGSYYGPHGIASVFLTFICGVGASYLAYMFCRLIYTMNIKSLNSILAMIGTNTLSIYLWHMAIYFVGDCIMHKFFGAAFAPDHFFVELFTQGYVAYRMSIAVIALTLLTLIGEYKTQILK